MQETTGVTSRLQDAITLPDTLAAAFDGFETIRQIARSCEDRVPGLLAAFMTTAYAAVDGREAITIAPALPPPGRADTGVSVPGPGAPVDEITGALAGLGAVLQDRLRRAATIAVTAGDRTACTDAALAAGRICQLMTRADDDSRLR